MLRILRRSLSSAPPEGLATFSGAHASSIVSYKGRKVFYSDVQAQEDEGSGMWLVTLDGRPLKTPLGEVLRVPSEALALGIATEWTRQSSVIEPATMPLMGLASTAMKHAGDIVGRVNDTRALLQYLHTDTMRVRFAPDEVEPDLLAKQSKACDPVLDWFQSKFGSLPPCADLIVPMPDPETSASVVSATNELSTWEFSALQSLTSTCKSVVLALGVLHREVTADDAFVACRVEEQYNIDRWGAVINGHDIDVNFCRLKIYTASSFLWLLDADGEEARAKAASKRQGSASPEDAAELDKLFA